MKKKTIALLMVVVLLFGVTVGGTIAWLTDTVSPVVNTFVVGNINIELDEAPLNADGKTINKTLERVNTNANYKLIPGNILQKDPEVRVLDESEACWLFIKIEESEGFSNYMRYQIASDWIPLNDVDNNNIADDGVYYREVASLVDKDNNTSVEVENANKYPVLKDDQVTVDENLTKQQLEAIATNPSLTITAYAVQKDNVASAAAAWEILFPSQPTS